MRQADRLIVNAMSNYALTFLTMVSQFVMIPIVVHVLQKEGFGVANMVLVPFGVFEVLTASFGRAMHRHIPQDVASNDIKRLCRTFSTALTGYMAMGLAGALAVFVLFDWLLSDPGVSAAAMQDGRNAMWVLIVWLVVAFPTWAYRKGLEAIQRYDLLGLSHGLFTLARTLLVIAVFWSGRGNITFFIASHLISLIFVNLLCRRFLFRAVPGLKESFGLVDRASLLAVWSFAAATLFGMIGEISGSYGFRILVGKQLGMGSLGALSAIWTIQLTMARTIDDLTAAFSPAISALDASGAKGNVMKLLMTGTKAAVLICATLAVVPIAAAAPFLVLWLGPAFREYETLLYVLFGVLLLYCVGLPSTHVLYGLGKVHMTGTVMFIRGVGGLLLSMAYVNWINRNLTAATLCMYGVQHGGGLVLFFKACRATGARVTKAIFEVALWPLALAVVAACATWVLIHQIGDDRMWKLGLAVVGGEITLMLLVMLLGFSAEERERVFSFASRSWSRVTGPPSA